MPFDPKIIRHDEALEPADLELPADLSLLGEQLRDDAQRLAACYPPAAARGGDLLSAAAPPKSSGTLRRHWIAASSALAGAAALGLIVALSVEPPVSQNQNTAPPAGRHTSPPAAVAGGAAIGKQTAPLVFPSLPAEASQADLPAAASAASGDRITPVGYSGELPVISPAVFDRGITPPEMEAWMDLRQNELAMDAESIEF